jgi:hypothetical protein
MRTVEQEWSEYVRALRTVAMARADAQQAQDRLTAHKSKAEATAAAEADAMAERGLKLQTRLNALAETAAASLQRAGLPAEGKRANHMLPEIRALNDLETVAERITKQLAESVDELEELRTKARALQEQRKRRTISAVLALVGFVLVWVFSGSFLAGVEAAAIASWWQVRRSCCRRSATRFGSGLRCPTYCGSRNSCTRSRWRPSRRPAAWPVSSSASPSTASWWRA